MGKSNISFLLPLLALMAVVLPFSISFRARTAASGAGQARVLSGGSEPGATKPLPSELAAHSAAKLVADYLDIQAGAEAWPAGDPRSQYTLDFILATVPDPIDSRLPYFFDSFLDSIQRASEASGYVLDSFDLAWPLPQAEGRNIETARLPARFENEPSLLLFRNPAGHKLLLLFLVGETPTGGIHKRAMASALQQISSFYPWGPGHDKLPRAFPGVTPDSQDVIKLMAPSFSGSAESLEFALRNWLSDVGKLTGKPPLHFQIISGTATAIHPGDFTSIGGDGKTSFQAVVPPDSDVMQALEAYLKTFGLKTIALLSEANTVYGRNLALLQQAGRRKRDAAAQPLNVRNLPFPLHISELRTASAKQQQTSKQPAASELPAASPTALPLPEGANLAATETPPFFSPLEVSSAELVLSNLLSTISREGIHAVGILATDVQDTIFLTGEIRAHCPSTVVFTLSSDLIFTHPTANPSTEGMLVVTPYPLFNLNQLWSAPFAGNRTRLQFPNQAAEGVYNAMLALLGRQDQILEYGPPFAAKRDQQILHPTLWVTAISRNGPLPVTLLDWNDPTRYSFPVSYGGGRPPAAAGSESHRPTPRPTARGVYTVGSNFAVAVLGLFLITFSLLVIRQYLPPALMRPAGRANWFARVLGDPVSPEYGCPSRLYMLAACVSLLSFYVLVAAAFLLPRIATYKLGITLELSGWDSVDLLALAAGLVTQCAAIALLVRAFRKSCKGGATLSGEVTAIVLAGSAAGLGSALYLAGTWFHTALQGLVNSPTAIFTYLRAFDVASGLSPLVPLFCVAAGAFLWAFCSFRRLRIIDGIRLARPTGVTPSSGAFLGLETASFEGVTDLESEVRELMESSSVMSTLWYLGLMGVALVAGCYYFFFRLVRSFEGTPFYILFGFSFFLVYWALAMEFARLWLLWHRLWRLLRRLSWHPMRAAFARYRKSFPELAKIDFATPPPTFTVLAFSVDQAERLLHSASSLALSAAVPASRKRAFEQWALDSEAEVRSAGQSLSDALAADAEGDWRLSIEKRSDSQCALARLTPTLTQLLEVEWRPSATRSLYVETPPEMKGVIELGEEFLVGRVVHFISFVLPSLRNLGAFVLTGLLLMLGAVVAYPFQPRGQFLLFNWVVILSFVGAAMVILVQMERDIVLSALSGTTPGQVTVTRQFVFRILTYVLLPVMALLGAQFPDTVGQIASLLGAVQGHP